MTSPRTRTPRRTARLAWGGIVGPALFLVAWATAGTRTQGYSLVEQAISELAGVHAPTRWLMSAGFACFGVAVLAFSVALRETLGGRAWLACAVTGAATLGAGAFALDASPTIDLVHVAFAGIGYVSLALAPMLAAQPLAARGHRRAAIASRLVGALVGACLLATALVSADGLLQRTGLTLGHAWLAACAVAIIRAGRHG